MDLTIRQIKELLKWMKSQGITKASIGDTITVEFEKEHQMFPEQDNTTETSMKAEEDEQDVLYWSS